MDLAEFVEDYLRAAEGRKCTNREIAAYYCEVEFPQLEGQEWNDKVDEIEKQLPYYTGVTA